MNRDDIYHTKHTRDAGDTTHTLLYQLSTKLIRVAQCPAGGVLKICEIHFQNPCLVLVLAYAMNPVMDEDKASNIHQV